MAVSGCIFKSTIYAFSYAWLQWLLLLLNMYKALASFNLTSLIWSDHSLSVSTVAHPPAVQACCLGEEANKKGV